MEADLYYHLVRVSYGSGPDILIYLLVECLPSFTITEDDYKVSYFQPSSCYGPIPTAYLAFQHRYA